MSNRLYVLPEGTSEIEALMIRRQIQMLVKLDTLMAKVERLSQVLEQRNLITADDRDYIQHGAEEYLYREVGHA